MAKEATRLIVAHKSRAQIERELIQKISQESLKKEKPNPIDLAHVKKLKRTKKLEKEIAAFYREAAKEIAEKLSKIPDGSRVLQRQMLNQIASQLKKRTKIIDKKISEIIKAGAIATAKDVIDANNDFMASVGLEIKGAFFNVPENVVENLLNGTVYRRDWSYSEAIWGSGNKVRKDIDRIVAKGIAEGKSTYEIAKDLETYVNPSARKPWDWSKVYPGSNKKVDYNAQRLARTLVQHSYQQAFRQSVEKNPFVEGVRWHSAFAAGRTCQVCKDRDGNIYEKGKEPLDHPNGLCWLEAVIPKSMDQIADEIIRWGEGERNPALDMYALELSKR